MRVRVKQADGQADSVPFLRGILTRSLQEAGLSFEDSYRAATEIRAAFEDDAVITNIELRERVREHLLAICPEVVPRYERPGRVAPPIQILAPDGSATAFSRGRHRLRMEACGISSDDAARLAGEIHTELIEQSATDIDQGELRRLTRKQIKQDLGSRLARRFITMEEFRDTGRPLLILIGGVAGTGKSTLASEMAYVLEILRTLPTDMLRELMRMLIPERLLPVLHTSSFAAWTVLPDRERPHSDHEELLLRGYMSQVEPVSLACEAVVKRALRERVHLILEGIHVAPFLLPQLPAETDAIVVPVLLGTLQPSELKRRLRGRGRATPDRRAERYLEHFDDLWRLQSFLLSEADRAGVPIVTHEDKDGARQHLLEHVVDAIESAS